VSLHRKKTYPDFAIGSSDTGAKEVPLKGTRQNGDITAHYFPVHYYNIHARK
jgi:hypothetical protein